ncbi:MAG TPA: PQQ-binding-like beta-propeller repeat protein [Candidatus Limnocylindrales bacterium]|nr:PQQ-binding-like beta-propeller repeat protein [Candidatus Limnocylindrales bacterium]
MSEYSGEIFPGVLAPGEVQGDLSLPLCRHDSAGFVHAIDIHTGATKWQYSLVGGGFGGTGTVATAGKLVFLGEAGGTFTALDETTGVPVWHFETGQNWRASPMTYMVGGRQYIALAGDGGIFSFALSQ